MSKSKGKMNGTPTGKRRAAAERKARKNVAKNSVVIFWLTAIVLVGLFVGRWVTAIAGGYYGSFVEVNASAAQAAGNMKGLNPGAEEKAELLPLQKQWDLFAGSRLRDEVTCEAEDGAILHGYLYNEGASVTAVVVPRFYQDGTADFLPGPALNALTGCNILLTDPRMHGGSGGGQFTYGLKEQYDIAAWLRWAEDTLGPQTFILWGEGTGANTLLMAAAHGLLPESVAFLAAESPYASLHELAQESIWKWYSVPAPLFLDAIELRCARRGFDVSAVDMSAILGGGDASAPDFPVLFLRGEYDSYILPAWSQAVEDAWPGQSETISAPCSHGVIYAAAQSDIDGLLARWWQAHGG